MNINWRRKTVVMGLALGSITALAAANAGWAGVAGFAIAQNPCTNPMTQGEINNCAAWQYEQADRKINQVYKQLKPQLSPDRQEELIDAQLAWIQFRDRSCELRLSTGRERGGSMEATMRYGCLAAMTQRRTADLEDYLRGGIPQPTQRNYQQADRELNQVYQQIVSRGTWPELRNAQLAWIAFRDANCEFEGYGSSANNNLCLIRMTEERTQELERYLQR